MKRTVSCGEIVYKPQSTYGPRRQIFFQLMFVQKGRSRIECAGEIYFLNAGEVAFLVPGHRFQFTFSEEEPTFHSWIHLNSLPDERAWIPLLERPLTIQPSNPRMTYLERDLVERLALDGPARDSLKQTLADAAFLEFLAGAVDRAGSSQPGHPSVEKARTHVKASFSEACDLKLLGRLSGMSPQHLTRLFIKETGMTPMRYLWQVREEAGARLLRETGLTVAEIADSCGFQNPYHFSRRIRMRYGLSPVALRKRFWETG